MTGYSKIRQILLRNTTAILLQNATEGYYKIRQVFYYKMRRFYYKMRELLQIATILLQNATAITKCNVYYNLRQYTEFQNLQDLKETVEILLKFQFKVNRSAYIA